MKILFVKQCGHRKEGSILECGYEAGAQYKAGGFAVDYVEPKPEPVKPAPAPKKKVVKPKSKE